MQAQIRVGSRRAPKTGALTYSVSMGVENATERKQPLVPVKNEDSVAGSASELEVVPSSELASPLAPVRNVSFRIEEREHGDIRSTESSRPNR